MCSDYSAAFDITALVLCAGEAQRHEQGGNSPMNAGFTFCNVHGRFRKLHSACCKATTTDHRSASGAGDSGPSAQSESDTGGPADDFKSWRTQ